MKSTLTGVERLFQALGDETRLRILALLLTGDVCVCHIHETLRLSQPKVSRHLAYLRRCGLVATRRKGSWVYYRLAELADPVQRTIRDAVSHTLGHVDRIQSDARRLSTKMDCCVPAVSSSVPGCACCDEASAQPVRISSARLG